MSDLTLEELNRIEARARAWGGAFHLSDDEEKRIIAAARAHLEGQEWKGLNKDWIPSQPPQQREDDGTGVFHTDPLPSDAALFPIAPAPSPTVEPMERILAEQQREADIRNASPDAGLVEELEALEADGPPFNTIYGRAAAALEAKDAEIERLKKAYPFHAWSKLKEEAQAEIERLRETLGRMVACPKCRYEPTEAP
jgi:hypothetical protein